MDGLLRPGVGAVMTTLSERLAEGWVWPVNAKKAHYFGADGRALCGKWLMLRATFEDGNDDSPDNCAACKRKVNAYRAGRLIVKD